MWSRILVLGALLVMAPLGAHAADLVVWWEKGFYPQEDEAVREIIAAFEHKTGKEVELDFHPQDELPGKLAAAFDAGQPPDFAFGVIFGDHLPEWAFDDRLVDLTETIGSFSNLFDPDALAWWTLPNRRTGRRGLYGLSMGRNSIYLHVWKSLLHRAGFTLGDIPERWDAFWSFWCDQVQPAVRRVTQREDIWGVGLSMAGDAVDTDTQFDQFRIAYKADYVSREGRLVIDDPEVRRRLVQAIESYTQIYRKGCTPPESTTWTNIDNNKAFLARTVVMTPNVSLSIPNALRHTRPEDYYENSATIQWPHGPDGDLFPVHGSFWPAAAFKDGGHTATAKGFVRFLIAEGWLAHYLDFSGERMLPAMPKLLEAPFWLDPSDPHHIAAVMQVESRPMQYDYATVTGNWRYALIAQQLVWPKAVHQVVADGITPEQAVDEAVARIKDILSEQAP
jgi:multiple sugar transport system substrate-binding protein